MDRPMDMVELTVVGLIPPQALCSVCHARFPSEGVIMWLPERFCGNWTVVDVGDALVGHPWRGREQDRDFNR
jgi:hypothetical protein